MRHFVRTESHWVVEPIERACSHTGAAVLRRPVRCILRRPQRTGRVKWRMQSPQWLQRGGCRLIRGQGCVRRGPMSKCRGSTEGCSSPPRARPWPPTVRPTTAKPCDQTTKGCSPRGKGFRSSLPTNSIAQCVRRGDRSTKEWSTRRIGHPKLLTPCVPALAKGRPRYPTSTHRTRAARDVGPRC